MKSVIKRNGSVVDFDITKIEHAMAKAFLDMEVKVEAEEVQALADNIAKAFHEDNEKRSVEDIQDLVEYELMNDYKEVAKAYILFRALRDKYRNKDWELEDLQADIYENKYRFDDESFEEFLKRVSNGNEQIALLMRHKHFLPAGRILANRGLHKHGRKVTYSNCYVLPPVEDSIEGIFDSAKLMARTFSYGGGVGIDISKLRPNGFAVNNSARHTSGAVSFMDLYSHVTGLIGQNGRRGALMLSMDVSHPDIEEFVSVKQEAGRVEKANISIKIRDDFMKAVKFHKNYYLHYDGYKEEIDANELYRKFCESNWDWAEPGMLFWDRIEQWNLMSKDPSFSFAGVNPCAEEPLPAGGSCLLSSINLGSFVINPFSDNPEIDWFLLINTVYEGVNYLNEVLDEGLELHPLEIQQDTVRDYRQIGLGVMGVADMLIKMGIDYGSDKAIKLCDRIGWVIANESIKASALLAKRDGAFPKYNKHVLDSEFLKANTDEDTYKLVKEHGLRNSQLLTAAPTGSLSTMWGISGGIEPLFNTSFTRKTESLHGEDVYYEVKVPIAKEASKYGIKEEDIVTAMNLDYKQRIKMQAVWQKHIDASISSTLNLPHEATVDDVATIYKMAWEEGLKGITVYRDGCKRSGVLTNIKKPTCPQCKEAELVMIEGCEQCPSCGYSPCDISTWKDED